MSKPTGYWLTIATDDDEVIGRFNIDGYDLRKNADRQMLGGDLASEMGTEHVEHCADLPGLND